MGHSPVRANKTTTSREAQVLSAGGSTMNTCLEKGEYEWAIKQIIILNIYHTYQEISIIWGKML